MRTKRGKLSILLGLLLIAAALSLLIYNKWESNRAGASSAGALAELKQELATPAPAATRAPVTPAPEEKEPEEKEPVIPEMPVKEIQGYDYIATLDIPAIELELPVMSEWDYERLKIAPCRYTGSAYTDDLVILGHAFERHFWPLHYLSVGDEVYLTDMDGNEIPYVIAEIATLEDTAIEEMVNSGYDLTLFTCTWNGVARLAVRCDRA